jgi:hypothetical protein
MRRKPYVRRRSPRTAVARKEFFVEPVRVARQREGFTARARVRAALLKLRRKKLFS